MTNGLHTHTDTHRDQREALSKHTSTISSQISFPCKFQRAQLPRLNTFGQCIKLGACLNRAALKSPCVCNVCVLESGSDARAKEKAADGSTCGRATAESFQERRASTPYLVLGSLYCQSGQAKFQVRRVHLDDLGFKKSLSK